MKIILSLLFVILSSSSSLASIELGAGLSSSMSGRYVPGANLAYIDSTWALSATTIGVQTTIYYVSDYSLCYNRMWNVGKFFWGDLHAGAGGGVGYSQRGYRSSPTSSIYSTRSEILIGPSFRVSWEFASPFVFTFDGLYGVGIATLGVPPLLHDLVMFSVGVRL